MTTDGWSKHRLHIHAFFVRNDPRILILEYLMAAVVPGWSMGSLQNAIWGCRNQLSNIFLHWQLSAQFTATPQSMDMYRRSWKKKVSTSEKRGSSACSLFFPSVPRDVLLSIVTSMTSDLHRVCLGPCSWRKHQEASLDWNEETIIYTIIYTECCRMCLSTIW